LSTHDSLWPRRDIHDSFLFVKLPKWSFMPLDYSTCTIFFTFLFDNDLEAQGRWLESRNVIRAKEVWESPKGRVGYGTRRAMPFWCRSRRWRLSLTAMLITNKTKLPQNQYYTHCLTNHAEITHPISNFLYLSNFIIIIIVILSPN